MIPFSVLDLSPILAGGTAAEALRNSLDLARHTERLGYLRYWLAEHHNMPGIASAATSVAIAHVAGGTSTIRVGAGGIMLPNHSPLVIAEQFGTLESLYPGLIDLGLGRGDDDLGVGRRRRGDLDGGAVALEPGERARESCRAQRFAVGQQLADGAAFAALERGHAEPGGVAGAGQRHVELAQVFAQAFAVDGGQGLLVGFQADAQAALGVVPAQRRVVLLRRTVVADEGQEHQRILQALGLVDGDHLHQVGIALQAQLVGLALVGGVGDGFGEEADQGVFAVE